MLALPQALARSLSLLLVLRYLLFDRNPRPMAESIFYTATAPREQRYQEILPQLQALIEPEVDLVANLANVVAVLREAMGFFWVGFYRRMDEALVLGPFQGPLACTRIALGQGVCGVSAQRQETVLVPDVEQFPGHIACSSASRSEIVVPLVSLGRTELILDIDSDQLDDFSAVDQRYLEQVIQLLAQRHYRLP
jgi:L-methionine (R)-S-oxide reductase